MLCSVDRQGVKWEKKKNLFSCVEIIEKVIVCVFYLKNFKFGFHNAELSVYGAFPFDFVLGMLWRGPGEEFWGPKEKNCWKIVVNLLETVKIWKTKQLKPSKSFKRICKELKWLKAMGKQKIAYK